MKAKFILSLALAALVATQAPGGWVGESVYRNFVAERNKERHPKSTTFFLTLEKAAPAGTMVEFQYEGSGQTGKSPQVGLTYRVWDQSVPTPNILFSGAAGGDVVDGRGWGRVAFPYEAPARSVVELRFDFSRFKALKRSRGDGFSIGADIKRPLSTRLSFPITSTAGTFDVLSVTEDGGPAGGKSARAEVRVTAEVVGELNLVFLRGSDGTRLGGIPEPKDVFGPGLYVPRYTLERDEEDIGWVWLYILKGTDEIFDEILLPCSRIRLPYCP